MLEQSGEVETKQRNQPNVSKKTGLNEPSDPTLIKYIQEAIKSLKQQNQQRDLKNTKIGKTTAFWRDFAH